MSKKYVHMLGICGTGMASLAGLLKERGYHITGSDQDVYPPMSDQLKDLGIKVYKGYKPENIGKNRPDLVVVGNVIRRDNPEAVFVIESKIPYMSMPQILSEEFLKDKESIVICGTHGKTTTASLMAWMLSSLKDDPGFLIGGIPLNFEKSYHLGGGHHFVIEGDEYDTAFFDKGPKFLHYRPKYAILTSIEFDHADIYKDQAHVEESFRKFISIIPKEGVLVANFDDEVVRRLTMEAKCKVVGYSMNSKTSYNSKIILENDSGAKFKFKGERLDGDFLSPLNGRHNVQNVTAVLTLLDQLEFDQEGMKEGLKDFKGVARRQQIVGESGGIIVIDDFAHHPSAIKETIIAMRSRFSNRRIWAVFEPRSNTSRRNIFQNEFADALSLADLAVIAPVFKKESIPENERLDVNKIIADLKNKQRKAFTFNSSDEIADNIAKMSRENDVVLVMSNGGFDGVHKKILEAIKRKK